MSSDISPVILLTNTLQMGGTERNIKVLCKNLPDPYQPEIWCIDACGELELPVHTVKRFGRFDPFFVFRLARQLSQHPAKIVHIFHVTIGIYFLFANALIRKKKKAIFSFGSARNDRFYTRRFMKMVNRRSTAVTGNSQAVQARLIAFGIDPAKVSVVPNGHEPETFQSTMSKPEIRKQLGVETNGVALITTGRLIESKRHIDLVEAMRQLKAKSLDLELWIIGDGPLEDQIRAACVEKGVADQVKLLGYQANVSQWLLAADLFVFPSETEGLPNSVIEAALAGLPIVACEIDGVVDIIENEKTGLLIPARRPEALADAIEQMIESPAKAEQFALAARQNAREKFSVACMVSSFTQLYEQVNV